MSIVELVIGYKNRRLFLDGDDPEEFAKRYPQRTVEVVIVDDREMQEHVTRFQERCETGPIWYVPPEIVLNFPGFNKWRIYDRFSDFVEKNEINTGYNCWGSVGGTCYCTLSPKYATQEGIEFLKNKLIEFHKQVSPVYPKKGLGFNLSELLRKK